MTELWAIFLALQIFGAGNINYQQDAGYYEINPIYHVFGDRHPSKEQVYLVKAIETGVLYGATKIFPKHKKKIMAAAVAVQVGFIIYDNTQGISMQVKF